VKRVAVVGGGVIERDTCGSQTSAGNAGWITLGLSAPIPAPGVVQKTLPWMLKPGSPFRIKPRIDPAFLHWLWRFWRSSRRDRFIAGLHATLRLNAQTWALFEQLHHELQFEMHSHGLTLVAATPHCLQEYAELLEIVVQEGYAGSVQHIAQSSITDFEPSLAAGLAGAIHLPGEKHLRPEDLTSKLALDLQARGVEVLEHANVRALDLRDGKAHAVQLADRKERADAIVIAAGVWSTRLLRTAGFSLPLQGAKGYSLTSAPGSVVPQRPLYLIEQRLGVSPFNDRIRLAGTLELIGNDLRVDARRAASLKVASRTYLRDGVLGEPAAAWTGLRPLLPDGLPAIGAIPEHDNLYVATGHGTLGVTMAAATGALLADAILNQAPPEELRPFSPGRFVRPGKHAARRP
jgi:D-amino-acid dehydrogenase